MTINEKEVIKYIDIIINDLENPFDEFTVFSFLEENKEHLSKRKDIAETYNLEDTIINFGLTKKLLKKTEGRILVLDDRGIKLKDFKKGYLKFEKKSKSTPFTKYQKIYLPIIIISFLFAVFKHFQSQSIKINNEELIIERDSLKTLLNVKQKEIDSLNIQFRRIKTIEMKLKAEN